MLWKCTKNLPNGAVVSSEVESNNPLDYLKMRKIVKLAYGFITQFPLEEQEEAAQEWNKILVSELVRGGANVTETVNGVSRRW